ncbi:putative ribonuclease H-like domain-containing protein [Tanacetum coccineum]
MIRNKTRLVAQGYTKEEGIDYDEVFALVARIEAIRLFIAYVLFKDFVVYQMDVNSAFLYGKIEEEVYVYQPPRFKDPEFPNRVYKVEKALYGIHQAPKAWNEMCTEFEKLMHKKFQMSSMGELTFFLGLQVTRKDDGIFINQDKYADEILKKFGFSSMKIASTPMETSKPLIKDAEAEDDDVYLYRSMIGSLMYLTASRFDIMFAICACVRFQVSPKVSHLHAVKRIFRYLKGPPKLGLWKSTTRGCQFLRSRLISWQCKKQTIVANSTTEAKYVAAASCSEYAQMMLETAADDAIQVSTVSLTYYWLNLFWKTAIASTLHNGEMEITATIDGKIKIVTKESIRRHLKLEDSDGAPSTSQPHLSPTLRSYIRQETKVPRSSSPPHTNIADKAASTCMDVRYGGDATTVTGLKAGQGGVDLVVDLETYMTQTKKVYGAAFTKLIKKVKRLEKKDKLSKSRRKLRLVLSNEEGSDSDILAQKDPSKQGMKIDQVDEDEGITLVQIGVSTASIDFTTANVPVTTVGTKYSTASPEVKTVGDYVDDIAAKSLAYIRRSETKTKDKGKGIMEEFESAMTKKKKKQEQERLGYEATLRLQEQLDAEETKRTARAHEAASSFNIEE